ncbi:MAG: type II secretion system F family protein [Pseudomonadota bacterium]
MKAFEYSVIDRSGSRQRGVIIAGGLQEAREQLNRQVRAVVRLRLAMGVKVSSRLWRREWPIALRQLQQLAGAGVPMATSFAELARESRPASWATLLALVGERLSAGSSLSEALEPYRRTLPTPTLALVAAGEESGTLEEQLGALADWLEWREARRAEMISALIYPAVAALATLLAVVFLLVYLVPRLAPFLLELGVSLPWYSRLLFALSDAVLAWGLWLSVIPLGLLAAAIYWRAWRRLPLVGRVIAHLQQSQFSLQMALLYAAGLTLPDALERAMEVFDRQTRRGQGPRPVAAAVGALRGGESLSAALAGAGLFPSLMLRVIRVGEQSGGLEESFRRLSDYYSECAARRLGQLHAMLAPAVSVILALMLLWIVAGIFLPLYDALEVMV